MSEISEALAALEAEDAHISELLVELPADSPHTKDFLSESLVANACAFVRLCTNRARADGYVVALVDIAVRVRSIGSLRIGSWYASLKNKLSTRDELAVHVVMAAVRGAPIWLRRLLVHPDGAFEVFDDGGWPVRVDQEFVDACSVEAALANGASPVERQSTAILEACECFSESVRFPSIVVDILRRARALAFAAPPMRE